MRNASSRTLSSPLPPSPSRPTCDGDVDGSDPEGVQQSECDRGHRREDGLPVGGARSGQRGQPERRRRHREEQRVAEGQRPEEVGEGVAERWQLERRKHPVVDEEHYCTKALWQPAKKNRVVVTSLATSFFLFSPFPTPPLHPVPFFLLPL